MRRTAEDRFYQRKSRALLETPMNPSDTGILWRTAAWLLLGCAGLALLTWIGVQFDFNHPATSALLYMIVIVLVSMTGNIAAGIGLAIIAALCLNYFFTEPRFSFQINAAEDVAAVIAFALTAVIIANLVGRARRLGEATVLRDQLQFAIDTIPAMVWSNLPDGSTEFLNKRFRDYAGIAAEEGQGSAWMNILHPDDRTAIDWHGALVAGEPFEKEARLRSSDGEYRRFLLRFVPLRDRQGGIVKWYGESTDIEDLRRAEEELRRRPASWRLQSPMKSASRSPQRSPTPMQRGAGLAPSRLISRKSARPLAVSSGTGDEPVTSSAGSARSSGRRRRGTTGRTSTR
jgi:PAS domain S-box-containing protein